jgi:hypothetical protein
MEDEEHGPGARAGGADITAPAPEPARLVVAGDGLAWLAAARAGRAGGALGGCSIVTSLPDASELAGPARDGWAAWFEHAAQACCEAADPEGLAVFYQTDVKHGGRWVDKGLLVARAAERAGLGLVFHKIVLRAPAGSVRHGRAGYSHLLAFSRSACLDLARPGPDVLPEPGPTTWTRGMGLFACRAACDAVLRLTPTRTVVDPFCGHGTVLAVAESLGLRAIGVELGHKRARRARTITVEALAGPRGAPPAPRTA